MRRWLWIGITAFTLLPCWSQPPTPKPYSGGDYWVRNENTWLDWEVTCPQLSGHLCSEWPENDEEPGALLNLDWKISRWPVVAKFSKGDYLKARPDSVGGIMWKDFDGSTWMRVQVTPDHACFVRANAKFLKPVKFETAASREPVQTTLPEPEK